ncbi:hypothetical protein B0H13DRAFT_1910638 [Mycena leptocephala]|nr:hypothetical protein B0H13DRAFT_1910638 [Mycena leptocephala]
MADITSIPLEHTATRNSGINAGTAETAKEQIKRTTGNSQRAMRAQTNKRLGTTGKRLGTAKGILGTANGQLGTANGKLRTVNGKLRTTNGKLGSTASGKLRTANGKLGSANWVQATTNTYLALGLVRVLLKVGFIAQKLSAGLFAEIHQVLDLLSNSVSARGAPTLVRRVGVKRGNVPKKLADAVGRIAQYKGD